MKMKGNYAKTYEFAYTKRLNELCKYLNVNHYGDLYSMFIRKSIGKPQRFEVSISLVSNPYKIIYAHSGMKADTVFKTAEKYNVNIK